MHAVADNLHSLCGPSVLGQAELRNCPTVWLQPDEHLLRQRSGFNDLYLVLSGTLKTYTVNRQGNERVRGFHFAGDPIGLDGIAGGSHHFNVMALEETMVRRVPFEHVTRVMARGTRASADLLRWLSGEILAMNELTYDYPARDRLACFLLTMLRKTPDPVHPNRVRLVMARADIGNYLGMATETVSRNITRMTSEGLIAARGRNIDLLDSEALRRLAEPALSGE
jgi:CRP/FNR family transcriptional regulator